jgi:transposase InsO family protein
LCAQVETSCRWTDSTTTVNAFVESFNGRLRDERLNTHWFLSLADAGATMEVWRRRYKRAVLTLPGLDDAQRICFIGRG